MLCEDGSHSKAISFAREGEDLMARQNMSDRSSIRLARSGTREILAHYIAQLSCKQSFACD